MPAAPGCSSAAGSPTRPTAAPAALTLLDRKRLELARALATGPRVLLLDEVAGGLVEHETAALVDLINEVRATGVSIIWIEHVVHALIAAVDRLVVLHGGALIAEGDPPTVIRRPQVAKSTWASRRDALMPDSLCRCARSTPITATSRRCSASRCGRGRGRGGGGDRRQRRRQDDAAQMHRRRDARSRHDAILFHGEPIGGGPGARGGGARHRAGAGGAAAVSLAHRRGESADRRPARPQGPVESAARLRAVSDAGGAPRPAGTVVVRRPAADGGHRPRADVESRRCCCATRSASVWRRSSSARSTRALPAIVARRAVARHRRAGHRAGARRPRATSIACRRAAWRCRARPATLTREKISAAYFGV